MVLNISGGLFLWKKWTAYIQDKTQLQMFNRVKYTIRVFAKSQQKSNIMQQTLPDFVLPVINTRDTVAAFNISSQYLGW